MDIDTPTKDTSSPKTAEAEVAQRPFDLEAYISRYDQSSETKLQRLLFVAKHSKEDDVIKGCFEMIEKHCRDYGNIKRYKEVFGPSSANSSNSNGHQQNGAGAGAGEGGGEEGHTENTPDHHHFPHPSTLGFHYDAPYITSLEQTSNLQYETLEQNRKQTLTTMSKSAIRSAYIDLAHYHKHRSELREAIKQVKRSQDYCTTSHQSGYCCLYIIELSLDCKCYGDVRAYIGKAEHTSDLLNGDLIFASKLRAASALVSLSERKYADAAMKLSSISSELTNQFSTVISAEDIALYGSILGLASLDRDNLQSAILDSSNFKGRLELVPPLRDALRHYVRAEYGPCLSLLSSVIPEMRLDIHLSKHVDTLYGLIRDRCIVQYFVPYSTACIRTMGSVFHMSVDDMEETLARLIGEGRLPGRPRIDSLNKIVKTESVVCTERRRRKEVERKVKIMGERFVKETESMILRMSCLEHGLIVQNDKQGWRGQRYAGGPGGGGARQRNRSGGSYDQGVGPGGVQGMYGIDDSSDDDVGDADMMDMEGYGAMNPEDV